MSEITMTTAYLCPISISGDETQKEKMREKISTLKSLAEQYDGKVLPETEFPDGFFMEVVFNNEDYMKLWKRVAGIKGPEA